MFKRLYSGLTEGQRQFIKFSFVGGIGFLVDAGTFYLLIRFTPLGLVSGRVVSSLVFGMSATYTLNRYLTFRDRRSSAVLSEYLRFASANIVGNLLNIGTHSLLVETLPLFHAHPILGIVAGTAVGLVFNFTLSKYFVFRAAKPG
ncbi:MAG TPA: GtrA family protein [Alphaproteobacteria bacterium]|nr:GtrA family protein [Alphaproteobacteria bacterium]